MMNRAPVPGQDRLLVIVLVRGHFSRKEVPASFGGGGGGHIWVKKWAKLALNWTINMEVFKMKLSGGNLWEPKYTEN